MIRLMRDDDVEACLALSAAAGWNQVAEDWLRVRTLEPEGCFVLEADGRAVASATVVCFGRELAWIGMVLTLPEYRRRGLARRLMERSLEYCEQRRVACVKLDATDLGRPLYLDLGFVDEQPIERWACEWSGPVGAPEARSGTLEEALALDRRAFGSDRRRVLESFRPFVSPGGDGLVALRPGANARQLGPCVAASAEAAERLIETALAQAGPGRVFWDLLPANESAARLAERLGFAPARRLVRMSRPAADVGDSGLVWATAGFEYG